METFDNDVDGAPRARALSQTDARGGSQVYGRNGAARTTTRSLPAQTPGMKGMVKPVCTERKTRMTDGVGRGTDRAAPLGWSFTGDDARCDRTQSRRGPCTRPQSAASGLPSRVLARVRDGRPALPWVGLKSNSPPMQHVYCGV